MNHYSITITFDSDRELTAAELEDLETNLIAQVQEPADQDGEDVEYQTSHQVINTIKGESK